MQVIYFNGRRLRLSGGRVEIVDADGAGTLLPILEVEAISVVRVSGDGGLVTVSLDELSMIKPVEWEPPSDRPDATVEYRPIIADAYRRPNAELELADLISLKADGPSIIFIRPQRQLSEEQQGNILRFCELIGQDTARDDIRWVFVPHDFDIFAVGEVEMRRRGWMRIPEEKTADQELADTPFEAHPPFIP